MSASLSHVRPVRVSPVQVAYLPYSSWQHIPLSPHDWGSCAPLGLTIARAVIGRRRPERRCVLHVKGGLLVDS